MTLLKKPYIVHVAETRGHRQGIEVRTRNELETLGWPYSGLAGPWGLGQLG